MRQKSSNYRLSGTRDPKNKSWKEGGRGGARADNDTGGPEAMGLAGRTSQVN